MTDSLGALMRDLFPNAEAATVTDPPPARQPLRIRRVRSGRVRAGAR